MTRATSTLFWGKGFRRYRGLVCRCGHSGGRRRTRRLATARRRKHRRCLRETGVKRGRGNLAFKAAGRHGTCFGGKERWRGGELLQVTFRSNDTGVGAGSQQTGIRFRDMQRCHKTFVNRMVFGCACRNDLVDVEANQLTYIAEIVESEGWGRALCGGLKRHRNHGFGGPKSCRCFEAGHTNTWQRQAGPILGGGLANLRCELGQGRMWRRCHRLPIGLNFNP